MKKLWVLLATISVSVVVALTYFYFEAIVRHSIDRVWTDWFNTGSQRILLVPLCVVLTLAFFGVQHWLDPKSESQHAHGLGEMPSPTVINFAKILGIGFLSLLAGASLGPEAILVPACMVVGGFVGAQLFHKDKQATGLLAGIGFVALMAAFFNSFLAGMLGLALVSKQAKVKLQAPLVVLAAVASAVTVLVLGVLESSAYAKLPPTTAKFNFEGALLLAALFAGGYGLTFALGFLSKQFEAIQKAIAKNAWWRRALVASAGLSLLYLLGGTLVEFTGNEAILPMLQRSASLGLIGLAWIIFVKLLAIGWCKSLGYRGGLVFPSLFVASTLVAIGQLYVDNTSFILSLVVTMAGMLVADSKVKVLL